MSRYDNTVSHYTARCILDELIEQLKTLRKKENPEETMPSCSFRRPLYAEMIKEEGNKGFEEYWKIIDAYLDPSNEKTKKIRIWSKFFSDKKTKKRIYENLKKQFGTWTAEKQKQWAEIWQMLEDHGVFCTMSRVNSSAKKDSGWKLILSVADTSISASLKGDAVGILAKDNGPLKLEVSSSENGTADYVHSILYLMGRNPYGNDQLTCTSSGRAVIVSDKESNAPALHITVDNHAPYEEIQRTRERAVEELESAANEARKNFEAAVNLDALIQNVEKDEKAVFSDRQDCAKEQKYLFNYLKDDRNGDMEKRIKAAREKLGQYADRLFYRAQHYSEESDEPFDAAAVFSWMPMEQSVRMERRKFISLLRECNVQPEDIRPSDFRKELVYMTDSFDELNDHETNPFRKEIYEAVKETVISSGYELKKLKLDRYSGILEYELSEGITGQIGQIFERDKNNCLITKFGSTASDDINSGYLIPGYKAFAVPPENEDEKGTLPERLRLYGYEHKLIAKLQYQLRRDLYFKDSDRKNPTVLNKTYTTGDSNTDLPFSRHEYGFDKFMPEELKEAILKTESMAVSFADMFKENTGLDQAARLEDEDVLPNEAQFRIGKDEEGNWYNLSLLRGKNCSYFDGWFDPTATGSGKNQGFIRYLADGITVNAKTMKLEKQENSGMRTPLLELPYCSELSHSPFDRQQMVFSNLKTCIRVSEPAGFAQMTFGGWNFDDGFVVSKKFAEKYHVNKTFRRPDGSVDKYHAKEERALMVGDKLCDFAGNKGVISLIVDPDMTEEQAKKKDPSGSLWQAIRWFRTNPELEVVGAPYTAPSRFNGGTVLQMKNTSGMLGKPDQGTEAYALGFEPFIITHHAVDTKTRVYEDRTGDNLYEGVEIREERGNSEALSDAEEELEQHEEQSIPDEEILDDDYNAVNTGRRISAQLGWILGEKKCTHIMHEFYGGSKLALNRLKQAREYLIVLGMDLNQNGELCDRYIPHPGEHRRDWEILPGTLSEDLYQELNHYGGFLLVPWALKYANGRTLEKVKDRKDSEGRALYRLPILSPSMRSPFYLQNTGAVISDEYTSDYRRLLNAVLFQSNSITAQHIFDSISERAKNELIANKHNFFKEFLMTSLANLGGTAVWTEDPTLNLDEARVSSYLMENLHLCDWRDEKADTASSRVLIWRDPILRSGGVRYMKVVAGDENMYGIAINPIADKSFDGDFDGDTVAVVRLHTKEAAEEAVEKFSLQNNLLDYGAGRNSNNRYSLYINHSLDLKQVEFETGSFRDEYNDIEEEANKADSKQTEQKVVEHLNTYVHKAFLNDYGKSIIHFDPELTMHLNDIWNMSDAGSGAKGKFENIGAYLKFLGLKYPKGEDAGHLSQEEIKKYFTEPEKLSPEEELTELDHSMYETQYATAVKSYGTGIAGAFSQRGIEALRNQCSTEVTELTYPVTQAILQAKHSASRAKTLYDLAVTEARRIWSGKDPEPDMNSDDSEKKLPKNEWIEKFMDLYINKSKMSVSINRDYVQTIADILDVKDESNHTDHIQSIESKDFILQNGSTLDVLAYEYSFKWLKEYTERKDEKNQSVRVCLYGEKGTESSLFAPDVIWQGTGFYFKDTQEEKK